MSSLRYYQTTKTSDIFPHWRGLLIHLQHRCVTPHPGHVTATCLDIPPAGKPRALVCPPAMPIPGQHQESPCSLLRVFCPPLATLRTPLFGLRQRIYFRPPTRIISYFDPNPGSGLPAAARSRGLPSPSPNFHFSPGMTLYPTTAKTLLISFWQLL